MSRLSFVSLIALFACNGGNDTGGGDTGPVDTGCEVDVDRDGYCADVDCDDNNKYIHPGAIEVPYDGEDWDCDGKDITDVDGDGHDAIQAGGDDCNDSNKDIYPGAPEDCYVDLDYNCDGYIPKEDCDADGFKRREDCDDENPAAYPGAPEVWYDGVDTDCEYDSDFDQDHDGDEAVFDGSWDTSAWPDKIIIWDPDYDPLVGGTKYKFVAKDAVIAAWNGDDCDDENPIVYGKAKEPWDGVDHDCDGFIDHIDIGDAFATWDGTGGLKEKRLGTAVALVHDVDGDGLADVFASDAYRADSNDGVAYLLSSGAEDGRADAVGLGSVLGGAGFFLGWSVANLGDVDDDGIDDLAVGVPTAEEAGIAVFSGKDLTKGDQLILADQMVHVNGGAFTGLTVVNLGDLDHDTYDEVMVGSNQYTAMAYAVFSSADFQVGGSRGTGSAEAILGDETIYGGGATGGADLDGDGINDALVASVDYSVCLTDATGTSTLWVLPGSQLTGGNVLDRTGLTSVSGGTSCAGIAMGVTRDIDGDGYAEALIGDPGVTVTGEIVDSAYAGRLYVVDGNELGGSMVTHAMFIAEGSLENGKLTAPPRTGDHDGDGVDDLLVPEPGNIDPYALSLGITSAGPGTVYFIPGDVVAAGGTVAATDVATAQFSGKSDASMFGVALDIADIDGDGLDDFVVGQPVLGQGKVHVFFSALGD